jgi:RimJ/RimL family protein N-acetyltransferase
MQLITITEGDLALREAIETDPIMMAGLGGPNSKEVITQSHLKSLKSMDAGTCWCMKIIPDASTSAAGFIGIWESSWRYAKINEMGWMILPQFQGNGLATKAAREIIERARSEKKFQVIHAFPGITNVPSNKICEKVGFSKIEECVVEYQSRWLRCNHWRLEAF